MQLSTQQAYKRIDEFHVLKDLGTGFTSSVHLVQNDHGRLFAAKKFKHQKTQKYFINEINILKKLCQDEGHQNIIKIYQVREQAVAIDVNQRQQKCSIILLEYAQSGQLYDYLAITGKFPQNFARVYFQHLVSAIKFMHNKNIYHLDLKPENIFLTSKFSIKISDFGLACICEHEETFLTCPQGSKAYRAPERYQNKYHGNQADIFALGVILFAMVLGVSPFDNVRDYRYKFLTQKNYNKFWKFYKKIDNQINISEQFKDLFQRLVAKNPQQRLKIDQILKHPWLSLEKASWAEIHTNFEQRMKKVEIVKQKKKQAQQKKRRMLMKKIHDQQSRSGQQNLENLSLMNLVQLYQQESQRERVIQQIKPIYSSDLILEENNQIAITFLKQYLLNLNKISPDDSSIRQVCIQEDSDTKIVIKINEKHFEEDSGNLNYWNSHCMEIRLGQDKQGNLVMRIKCIDGDYFSFKKTVLSIKQLFYYCLQ